MHPLMHTRTLSQHKHSLSLSHTHTPYRAELSHFSCCSFAQAFFSAEVAEIHFQKPFVLDFGWKSFALLALLVWYASHRSGTVYLIDFSTYKAPESWKLSPEQLLETMQRTQSFSEDSLQFMKRMLEQSGVGPATAWPPGIVQMLHGEKQDDSVEASRKEAEVIQRTNVVEFVP